MSLRYQATHRALQCAPPLTLAKLRRWAAGLLAGFVLVAMVVVTVGYASVTSAFEKINHQALGDLGARPQILTVGSERPMNILLIGSDTRVGGNASYGQAVTGQRADVTMIVHLSADRTRASAVSIPRDSMVELPSCPKPDGTWSSPHTQMFNAAFAIGGVTCTMRTVEKLTGIYLDHFVIVDFSGFKTMVDALGTVPICVPQDVHDVGKSNLVISAGRHEVDGETALAFVRNRTMGQGGDLGRVKRQQQFLATVINEASSRQVLTNPAKLMRFLNAAASSLTTDDGLDRSTLVSLARTLHGIGMDHITFVTVPTTTYAPDPNRLAWADQADPLWHSLRTDTVLPGTPGSTSTASTTSAARAMQAPGANVGSTGSTVEPDPAPDSPDYSRLRPSTAAQDACQ